MKHRLQRVKFRSNGIVGWKPNAHVHQRRMSCSKAAEYTVNWLRTIKKKITERTTPGTLRALSKKYYIRGNIDLKIKIARKAKSVQITRFQLRKKVARMGNEGKRREREREWENGIDRTDRYLVRTYGCCVIGYVNTLPIMSRDAHGTIATATKPSKKSMKKTQPFLWQKKKKQYFKWRSER